MIRKGVLVRGQRIIETEIASSGREPHPLREALRMLESEGLVELFPHRGVHIRQPSMNEIQEIFDVMGVLEGTCARLTAEKMTTAGWRKIERLHQKLETHYAEGDREKYIAVNNVFHALVRDPACNRVLDNVVAGCAKKPPSIGISKFTKISVSMSPSASIGKSWMRCAAVTPMRQNRT